MSTPSVSTVKHTELQILRRSTALLALNRHRREMRQRLSVVFSPGWRANRTVRDHFHLQRGGPGLTLPCQCALEMRHCPFKDR